MSDAEAGGAREAPDAAPARARLMNGPMVLLSLRSSCW
jgi:hypothetical protein